MIATYSDLENKCVLITGATRGIGRQLAFALAAAKSHIVFNYREGKEEVAHSLAAELKEQGAADATPLLFDVTNAEQIKQALTTFTKEVRPITGLVNNAGISKDQILLRIKEEDVSSTINTNLVGPILISAILGRNFMKEKDVSIVNMSSVVGLMGNASQISYAASKAGLIGLTKSYAKELASRGVRCNALCPGFIATEMTQQLDEKAKEKYLANIPLKRFGECQEVANVVLFLLSSASSYITGEVIKIDGGLYI